MTKAAGDRGLVLGRPDDCGDCLVSGGALAAAKIDLAIRGERVAVISIGAGVGGGGMARNQMIDRKRVFDGAQAVLYRSLRRAHVQSPVAVTRPYNSRRMLSDRPRANCTSAKHDFEFVFVRRFEMIRDGTGKGRFWCGHKLA